MTFYNGYGILSANTRNNGITAINYSTVSRIHGITSQVRLNTSEFTDGVISFGKNSYQPPMN